MLTGYESYIELWAADQYFAGRLHADDWPQEQPLLPNPSADAGIDQQNTSVGAQNEARALRLENALRLATAILDRQPWRGRVAAHSQPLSWPRQGMTDGEGRIIPPDLTPLAVKYAAAELALALLRADLTRDDRGPRGITAKQVGDLRIQYRQGMDDALPRVVRDLLRPFLLADAHSAALIP